MRTLKKSLCLVLALVMVLGLCVIGTNAAYAQYTDKAKIDYVEAVEVLTGLEVIEGYPDGSFNPTANVTRAEAAAMIARMMLGREKADKLPVGDVKFTDVPETNWAAKYIAFCANRGIIVGMGDGTFRPSENVTGTQMATMLLRALGYGVMGEYEGKGWDINAVADALYYKLFEDSKVTDFNQAATREETALYVWNTMRVHLVGYDVDLNYYKDKGTTFALEAFNLIEWEYAQLLANQETGANYTVVEIVDGYKTVTIDGVKHEVPVYDEINLNIETGLDLIGHEVTVYFKGDAKEDKVNHVDYFECYMVIDESTVLSKGWTYDDFYRNAKAANKTNVDVKFNDVETWTNYDYNKTGKASNVDDYDDYGNIVYTEISELKGQKSSMDLSAFFISGTWILDHEGKIMLVLKTNYRLAEVKNVDNSHSEVEAKVHPYRGDKAKDWPEIYDMKKGDIQLVYDGIAKGDYVVVQPVGDLFYLQATTTQTIDVTERYNSFGSWYFNGIGPDSYGLGIEIDDQDDPADVNVGDKVLLYMTEGGSYFGLQILEKAKSAGVVYVNYYAEAIDHGAWDTKEAPTVVYKVQCVNQDGEEVVYTVKKETYDKLVASGTGVYEAFVRSGYATFSAVKETSTLKKADGKNSYVKNDATGDIYYVTADTKVYYINDKGNDMTVKAASKLANGSYDVYFVAKKSGGSYKLATVWVPGQTAPASYADSYIYVDDEYYGVTSPAGYELYKDTEDAYYNVYIDGVPTKVHLSGPDSIFHPKAPESVIRGFYQYTMASDGTTYVFSAKINNVAGKTPVVNYDVELTKGMVKNGKLYAEGSDGVAIKCDIVDVSGDTTKETKTDAAVNSLDRLEELLNEGYTITVDYMIAVSDSNEIPTGVMYVTVVVPPAK
jgi:hypothetical protein